MMNLEAEVREIKQSLADISKEIDDLLDDRESISMMRVSEESLGALLDGEPDIYRMEDLKVRCRK